MGLVMGVSLGIWYGSLPLPVTPSAVQSQPPSHNQVTSPVKRVEVFLDLTCPYCGKFYESVLPLLQTHCRERGIVLDVSYLPLNGAAYGGEKFLSCVPSVHEYRLRSLVYREQSVFIADPLGFLKRSCGMMGIPTDGVDTCVALDKTKDTIYGRLFPVQGQIPEEMPYVRLDGEPYTDRYKWSHLKRALSGD